MPNQPKDDAASSRPVHGSINPSELRALGLNLEDLVDFSASISPIEPSDIGRAVQSMYLVGFFGLMIALAIAYVRGSIL